MKQRGASAHLRNAGLQSDGAQSQTGIHVAVEGEAANGAAVPATGGALLCLNMPDRPRLGGTCDRHRPGVGEKAVQRVELRGKLAFDMIHSMD